MASKNFGGSQWDSLYVFDGFQTFSCLLTQPLGRAQKLTLLFSTTFLLAKPGKSLPFSLEGNLFRILCWKKKPLWNFQDLHLAMSPATSAPSREEFSPPAWLGSAQVECIKLEFSLLHCLRSTAQAWAQSGLCQRQNFNSQALEPTQSSVRFGSLFIFLLPKFATLFTQ